MEQFFMDTLLLTNILLSVANLWATGILSYRIFRNVFMDKGMAPQVKLVGYAIVALFGVFFSLSLLNLVLVLYNLVTGDNVVVIRNIGELTAGLAIFIIATFFIRVQAASLMEPPVEEGDKMEDN